MGVATATIMFFRSLGGSVMLAVSGTVLNKTIRAELPWRTPLSAVEGIALIREPEKIAALPPDLRDAVVHAVSTGVGRIQLIGAFLLLIGVGWALAMPELPLRNRAGLTDVLKDE